MCLQNCMEHFKTDLEPICARGRFCLKTFKRCLFLLHKTFSRMESDPRSRNCCMFSLWKLIRNCSRNTKIATLSWSAHRMLTISVWFSKESTMLPPQTTKKWSDARLRKALTGWSLYYTRVSSIRSFRAVRSFCGSQQKTCLMICLKKYQSEYRNHPLFLASSFGRLSAVVPLRINKILLTNKWYFAPLVPDSMTSRVEIFITWNTSFRKVQVRLCREHHCTKSYCVSENTIETSSSCRTDLSFQITIRGLPTTILKVILYGTDGFKQWRTITTDAPWRRIEPASMNVFAKP